MIVYFWHFMASGMCFKFDTSHHAVMVFLVLEVTVVFIIARVPLLKLQWQGSRIVLRDCSGHLVHLSLGVYSNSVCARIATFWQLPAIRAQNGLSGDFAAQKRSCKVVGSLQFSVGNPGLWSVFSHWFVSQYAVIVLLVLEAIVVVLLITRVPPLKLQLQGSK